MAESPIKSPPRKTTQRSNSTKTKNAKSETLKKRTKSVAKTTAPKRPMITVEERYRLIAESAYYRAHDRHFEGGDSLRDWLDAENDIDSRYETVNPR